MIFRVASYELTAIVAYLCLEFPWLDDHRDGWLSGN